MTPKLVYFVLENELLNFSKMTHCSSFCSQVQLENELEELKKQNEELNEQLDNILYSLSVQGVSGIKENNGEVISLKNWLKIATFYR